MCFLIIHFRLESSEVVMLSSAEHNHPLNKDILATNIIPLNAVRYASHPMVSYILVLGHHNNTHAARLRDHAFHHRLETDS